MTLPEWLQYLETLPSGLTNHSLDHLRPIAQKLNLLKLNAQVITVAGTNGKGSCVIFLEAILLAANYQVAAYISPHLLRYNERIRVNGTEIDDASLCSAFAIIEATRGGVNLSYFEFTTLTALWLFQRQKFDFYVLEVGLGGKYDAVNILDPDIAIISTIALDHTQILGNTRAAIGKEKAGIMRPHIPVICGDPHPPATIIAAAKMLQADLYRVNKDFFYQEKATTWEWRSHTNIWSELPLPQLPIANAATALCVIELLAANYTIPISAIHTGLRNAYLAGRLQQLVLPNNRQLIFDVAHNPAAAQLLAIELTKQHFPGKTFAVMSMLNDKDITNTILPLKKIITKWFIGQVTGPRATSITTLSRLLRQQGIDQQEIFLTIESALKQAIAESKKNVRIVIFGSFHTVAAALLAVKNCCVH